MIALPRAQQRSRFLFDWSAKTCLSAVDQSLDAITGEVASFTRASPGTCIDAALRVKSAAHSQPRWQWSLNPVTGLHEVGLLLEGSGKNLVVSSDDLTNATGGWTNSGPTVTAGYATYAGRPFSRVVNAHIGNVDRSVTFTGDGTKAYSFLVKLDPTTGDVGPFHAYVRDVVGSTNRIELNWSFSAAGVPSVTMVTGTLDRIEPLGDGVYRIRTHSTSVTAANAHVVTPTIASGSTGVYNLLSGIHVEDAAFSSSLIPTGASTVTRSADAFSFAFNAVPQAMTAYVDLVPGGATDGVVLDLGVYSGVAFTVTLATSVAGTASAYRQSAAGGAGSGGVPLPAYASRAELRMVMTTTAGIYCGSSIDGAAETVGAATPADVLGSNFRTAVLAIGSNAILGATYNAIRLIRIAAGVQTMDYMRAG